MRMPFFMPGVPPGSERSELAALEAVVSDLRAYCRGETPTLEDLAGAPTIQGWAPFPDTSGCRLVGSILGHPHVRPGVGSTSGVVAIGRCGTWMRSRSRLWRLGPAISTDDIRG
jgi:hypothetical protein